MSGRRNKHKYDRLHNTRRHQSDGGSGSALEQVQYLANSKLSVFRELDDAIELHEAAKIFTKFGSNVSSSERGRAGQKSFALSQLALRDITINIQAFDGVLATQATDQIYEEVPTVRRPLYVRLGNVGLFGNKNAPFASVGIALHEDEWPDANGERANIIETLESLSPVEDYPFSWLPRGIPHISLGTIDADKKIEFYEHARDDIKAAVPDGILLKRATLHIPEK